MEKAASSEMPEIPDADYDLDAPSLYDMARLSVLFGIECYKRSTNEQIQEFITLLEDECGFAFVLPAWSTMDEFYLAMIAEGTIKIGSDGKFLITPVGSEQLKIFHRYIDCIKYEINEIFVQHSKIIEEHKKIVHALNG